MSNVKERIMGAVTIMNEHDANILWKLIIDNFSDWSQIEESEPDEFDKKLLADIETNPDCKEFIDAENIDWEHLENYR